MLFVFSGICSFLFFSVFCSCVCVCFFVCLVTVCLSVCLFVCLLYHDSRCSRRFQDLHNDVCVEVFIQFCLLFFLYQRVTGRRLALLAPASCYEGSDPVFMFVTRANKAPRGRSR